MTVAEVQAKVSHDELKWWMAYHRVSPISRERDDYNAALIASTMLNCHSTKKTFSIDDVRLKWGAGKDKMVRGAKNMLNLLRLIPGAKIETWQ